ARNVGLLQFGAGREIPRSRLRPSHRGQPCVNDAVPKVGATQASIDWVPGARNGGLQRGLLSDSATAGSPAWRAPSGARHGLLRVAEGGRALGVEVEVAVAQQRLAALHRDGFA